MILVTGTAGQVETALLQALSTKGIRTRAWIRREEQTETVVAAGTSEVFLET